MIEIVFLKVEPIVWIFVASLLVIMIAYIGSRIKIVKEGTEVIVERLGQYYNTWSAGFNMVIPFTDRVRKTYDLNGKKTSIINLNEQELNYTTKTIYSKDSMPLKVDLSLFLKINDSKLYVYAADNPSKLITSLAAKNLYNILIGLELDQINSNRFDIIQQLKSNIEEPINAWGVTVDHIEVNIITQGLDK